MAFPQIYTIGFTGKSAEVFFNILKARDIKQLLDIRLNNTSQLSAFAKKNDLDFFLRRLLNAKYLHEPLLAPTEDILKAYQKGQMSWDDYETRFLLLLHQRQVESKFSRKNFEIPTVLLCSEPTADKCHRRLVAEYLAQQWGGVDIIHL
jgi:uncharacterized protein (DUF488 family)